MNRSQYEALLAMDAARPVISVEQFANTSPRTLVYGYTVDRDTFHVYLEEGQLTKVVYDHDGILLEHVSGEELEAAACRPCKRVYPEACDHEMALLMHRMGVSLPYTTFNDDRPAQEWHGKRLEELHPSSVLEQLRVNLPVGLEDLGVPEHLSYLLTPYFLRDVRRTVNDQLESYMRAVKLRKTPIEDARRWLTNTPGCIAAMVKEATQVIDWDMPQEVAAALVVKMESAVAAL